MGTIEITLRMIIDACLQASEWRCPKCKVLLEQVWIGTDEDPDLNYVHCPGCNIEFTFIIAFIEKGDSDEA